MINHVSIGVKSLVAARQFYDAALGALGYRLLSEDSASLGYGRDNPCFWVLQNEAARPGETRPGVHFCFDAGSRAQVDAFHAGGLKAGGRDNGAPGTRAEYAADYYAAFLVDPDGYRTEAYAHTR